MKRILRSLCVSGVILGVILIGAIVISHIAGYDIILHYGIRIIDRHQNDRIESYDGRYQLIAFESASGKYMLFAISDTNDDNLQVCYTTQDLYVTRYVEEYFWKENSLDFVVYSTDTGTHTYTFNGTTWNEYDPTV